MPNDDRACYRCGRDIEENSDSARCHPCTVALADDDRAAHISARLAAATPGPWSAWDDGDGFTFVNGLDSSATRPLLEVRPRNYRRHEDADLIANAPADLAWLLQRIAELEAELAERQ